MKKIFEWVDKHLSPQIDVTSWTIGVVHREGLMGSMTYICFLCFQLVVIGYRVRK
jgi:hypothetical protein